MAFAPFQSNLSYWQKQSRPLFSDLIWNLPEQKQGNLTIVGGNSQSFSTPVRIAEFIKQNLPFAHINLLLPDALRGKIPVLSDVELLPSTESGSFAKSEQLNTFIKRSDVSLFIGDSSKNSATAVALGQAIKSDSTSSPLLITRDSVDLLATEAKTWLMRPNTFVVASMAQLQKVFQAVYYPRMILLSQPLIPVVETLHKFTLTYPTTLVTFHQENIIVAHNGKIVTTAIVDTSYSPISLWSGQLASKILALNFYNPHHALEATSAALLY